MAAVTAPWDQAVQALKQSSIPALRRLRMEANGESVTLTGHVPSYYYKQLAQETVMPFLAGHDFVNRIVVQR